MESSFLVGWPRGSGGGPGGPPARPVFRTALFSLGVLMPKSFSFASGGSENTLTPFIKPPVTPSTHCTSSKVRFVGSIPVPVISGPGSCLSVLPCSQVPVPVVHTDSRSLPRTLLLSSCSWPVPACPEGPGHTLSPSQVSPFRISQLSAVLSSYITCSSVTLVLCQEAWTPRGPPCPLGWGLHLGG